MQTVICNVHSIEKLNDVVYRVLLRATQDISFKAGQYLSVLMAKDDKRHFSIANAPLTNEIELHIGITGDACAAMQVIHKMEKQGHVEVEFGCGEAYLREESTRPIILLAGGTGFAYVKSLLEQITHLQLNNPVYLYWGVKEYSHLYFQEQALAWEREYSNIHFCPVIEHPQPQWQGLQGYVHQVVLNQFPDLSGFDIYIVGRFEMAKIARDDFVKQGALVEHIFGDAFAFI